MSGAIGRGYTAACGISYGLVSPGWWLLQKLAVQAGFGHILYVRPLRHVGGGVANFAKYFLKDVVDSLTGPARVVVLSVVARQVEPSLAVLGNVCDAGAQHRRGVLVGVAVALRPPRERGGTPAAAR